MTTLHFNHRGRTADGRFTHRVLVTYEQGDDLIEAKRKLTHILGMDGFRAWAHTLSDRVIMDDKAYIAAIEQKLSELQDTTISEEAA